MDNDNFDVLYSIIYYLEQTPPIVRKEIIENLNKGLKHLNKAMDRQKVLLDPGRVSENVETHNKNVDCFRNCLKAYMYLISWFLMDNNKLKETKESQ